VSAVVELATPDAPIADAIAARNEASQAFFDAECERLAQLCHALAERFARGGRLLALGRSGSARSDARHIAVEFVHPVIVGKRALPALALGAEGGDLLTQIRTLARPEDIVVAFGTGDRETAAALAEAEARGCLAARMPDDETDAWRFGLAGADPFVRQELTETLYHLMWELVHVFFEHRGLLAGRQTRSLHDAGPSAFLYPFLAESEHDLPAVLADVRASAEMKAREIRELRERTLREGAQELWATAHALRARLDRGGTVLCAGNGGSATDAADLVADLRAVTRPGWHSWPAIDLTEDTGVLTAIANDVGVEATFARQVIAHGREHDALLTLSTSGSSANVIAALQQARRQRLLTVALLGYDGGRIAAQGLADHAIVVRCSHIPRIQEAQASAYHVLRELLEMAGRARRAAGAGGRPGRPAGAGSR
jgi:D-sedoheptulose 7-phosphate isomerase